MPVINGVYLKDFTALPGAVADADIIPIAITGNQIAYRTTVAGIVTDARITAKLLTGLSVTGATILATDTILQAFGKVQNQLNGKVTSVGLTMPSAFSVANSPITSAGTLAVTAAGVASQYIRGDGALADFPTNGGGGSSVSYYLNGSVSQGTFVGNTYYEMNKTPVIGTGTDFTIGADGYIAQFITDANDPGSLLIPAGNWNVEMYFSASSNGGTPSFYVEVYKYNGTTFTLLGTSSATPEGITNGTAIDIYYTSVGIPETVLTITDRLAIRVYVTHSGRTITLHTEDNHLSEIVTTFSNGLTTLNGLTKQAQYFAVGSTGTDFAIVSSVDTHTFNLPTASASNRGALSSADWSTFNGKQGTITLTTTGTSGAATFVANTLNIPNYADGGVLSLSAIGATPNANAATITGTVLNLEPASASFGGVVTTGTQTFGGDKTIEARLTVNYGATTASSIQATSTNANGRALTVLANSTLEPFYVTQQGSGKLATFTRIVGGSPDERVTILNDGSIYTGGKVAIGTISAGSGGVDSVVVRNSSDTELKIVGTTGTGSAVFSASPTFTGTVNAAAVTLTGALSGTSATFSGQLIFPSTSKMEGSVAPNFILASTSAVGSGNGPYQTFKTNSSDFGYIGSEDALMSTTGNKLALLALNGLSFRTGSSYIERLSIASTGAATFSSSVTSANTTSNTINLTTETGYNYKGFDSYWGIRTGTAFDFNLDVYNSGTQINALKITQTGTATFSGIAVAQLFSGENSTSSSAVIQAWNKATSGDNKFIEFYVDSGGGTLRGSIDFNRSATLTRYNTTSDANLKNIIGDSNKQKSIDILNSTKIREFSWKADETNKPQIGVIAQELYETYKGAVSVGSDEELLGTEEYKNWQVDKTAFTFHLIAGFQEHERIIQELKAEIDLLKGEPIIPTDNNLE